MKLVERFRTWWVHSTAPGPVEQELAWRGHVLNTLLLGLIFFTAPFSVFNTWLWILGLESGGGVITAFAFCSIYLALFWLSKKGSISLAIAGFSFSNIVLSFLLSLGWGVADITASAIYAAAILEISILLRGKMLALVMGVLLTGYALIGRAQLSGWFSPPFYTDLSANHLTTLAFLSFLSFLGAVTAGLLDRVLHAQVAEAARRQELESRTRIAAEVQLSMLPASWPTHPRFDLAGQSIPARDVGGDFYSYHQPDLYTLLVIIGDVAGKGMPAALLMAMATGIIDSLAPVSTDPVELLRAMTGRLQKHLLRSRLNTACMAAYFQDNRLRVVNAGCIEPMIRRADGRVEWLHASGLPLGMEISPADLARNPAETELRPGDLVIFVTDGVVEATNKSRAMLGFEYLETLVGAGPAGSAEMMKHYILDHVEAHRGAAEQSDDVTVVVVRVKEDNSHDA